MAVVGNDTDKLKSCNLGMHFIGIHWLNTDSVWASASLASFLSRLDWLVGGQLVLAPSFFDRYQGESEASS